MREDAPMIFYHFTSLGHLPLILASGALNKSGIMLGEHGHQSLNAPWLTLNPDPAREYGLGFGQMVKLPPDVSKELGKGWTESVDKRTARITVKVPSTDRRLKHWIKWIQGRLGQEMLDWYIETGGGKAQAENWYVFLGPIPRSEFMRIEVRGERNEWIEATNEIIACIRPHTTGATFGVEPYPLEDIDL